MRVSEFTVMPCPCSAVLRAVKSVTHPSNMRPTVNGNRMPRPATHCSGRNKKNPSRGLEVVVGERAIRVVAQRYLAERLAVREVPDVAYDFGFEGAMVLDRLALAAHGLGPIRAQGADQTEVVVQHAHVVVLRQLEHGGVFAGRSTVGPTRRVIVRERFEFLFVPRLVEALGPTQVNVHVQGGHQVASHGEMRRLAVFGRTARAFDQWKDVQFALADALFRIQTAPHERRGAASGIGYLDQAGGLVVPKPFHVGNAVGRDGGHVVRGPQNEFRRYLAFVFQSHGLSPDTMV